MNFSFAFNKIKDFLFYSIFFFLILIPFWFKKKFGVVYFDQLIFHFELFVSGKLVMDAQIQKSFYKWTIVSTTICFFIYFFFKKNFLKNIKVTKFREMTIFFILILISINYNTSIFKNIQLNNNTFFEQNYIFNEPKKKNNNYQNLILIYIESLDNNFKNKNLYGENLLKTLEKLKGTSIKNFYQIPGYSFTISSLVSTHCGIPAKSFGFFHGSELKNVKNFLPNIKCLSDFTHNLNYKNIFITSDEVENFGVKYFLKNHNYLDKNIYDVNKLSELNYKTSIYAWRGTKNKMGGMHDDVLFEASLDIIKKEISNEKPFFLTIYTLDTHSPKGYPNQNCLKNLFKTKYLVTDFSINHSVKCTVKSLNDFVLKILELEKDIDIVILGDHKFPNHSELDNGIFNKFILKNNKKFNRDYMNHLDFFPTLMNILGYEFPNNRLGLGFSLYDDIDLKFYKEYSTNLDQKLSGKSLKYESFWK